jgi:hypothetical protein
MRHILAAVYFAYETSVYDDSNWEKFGKFVSIGKDDALWLQFKLVGGLDGLT